MPMDASSAFPSASVLRAARPVGRLCSLLVLAALATTARAQGGVQNAPTATVQTNLKAGVQADGPNNSQSQVQTAGAPRAPLDPAAAAALASGSAFPGIPPATPPIYLRRPGPLCTDFQPVANGGWAATGPIQFPGPQGPVQMVVGQTVVPGDYLDGMDLGSVLQRDCRRTPPLPGG